MADNRPKYNFGDILLEISENGSDIIILPNSFACDPTLGMSANVTIFSEKDWWGNYIIGDENKIGSDIETVTEVSSSGRKKLESILTESLQYLVEQNYAAEVKIKTVITNDMKYDNSISIIKKDGTKDDMYWRYSV